MLPMQIEYSYAKAYKVTFKQADRIIPDKVGE